MTESRIAPWLSASRWPTAPIRLVARLGSGHTPSRGEPEYWENCTIPWITLADVWQLRSGQVNTICETKEKISSLGLANSAAVKHPAGTVILSRTASVGFSAIMGQAMATSQDFATWTCGPRLEPRYLLHALRGMTPDLKRISTGSTHKTIYMPDIEQLRVPLPPVEEQRRIADFLDAETARIDKLAAKRFAQTRFLTLRAISSLSGTYQELILRYGHIRLRYMLAHLEQGWSPQCEDRQVSGQEWGVIKAGCVNSGVFDSSQHKALPDTIKPRREYALKEGDLLMSRASGSPELIGSVGIVHTLTHNLLLCDKVYRLSLDGRLGRTDFVAHMLRSHAVREHIKMGISGGEGMANNLPTAVVKDSVLPKAPLSVQAEIARKLDAELTRTTRARDTLQRSINLLSERRQALITAAVTGQFDVSTASGRNVTDNLPEPEGVTS